jgi:ActR/RegA family two-component response regulator
VNPSPKRELTNPLPLNLADAEELLIQRALDETGGNIAEAARLLGVHRTRIYRKLAQGEAATD